MRSLLLPNKNRDYKRPMKDPGPVYFNGKMAEGAVSAAANNKMPIWPMPKGQYYNAVESVSRGDIVYRLNGRFLFPQEYRNVRSEYGTVSAISALNGQGENGQSVVDFMNSIDIVGIAYIENEENMSRLFNIHCGGIPTMCNNGREGIDMGDWVMAWALAPEDLKFSGRKGQPEAHGVAKLITMPYRAEVHRVTTRSTLHVLQAGSGARTEHTDAFRTCASQCYEAYLDIGITFLRFVMDNGTLTGSFAGNTDEAKDRLCETLLAECDHPLYKAHSTAVVGVNRAALIDCFFVSDVPTKDNRKANATIFGKGRNNDEPSVKKLKSCQNDAASLFLLAQATYFHLITKNIIGQAVTSAKPGEDFQIKLMSYCR